MKFKIYIKYLTFSTVIVNKRCIFSGRASLLIVCVCHSDGQPRKELENYARSRIIENKFTGVFFPVF